MAEGNNEAPKNPKPIGGDGDTTSKHGIISQETLKDLQSKKKEVSGAAHAQATNENRKRNGEN